MQRRTGCEKGVACGMDMTCCSTSRHFCMSAGLPPAAPACRARAHAPSHTSAGRPPHLGKA